MPYSFIFMAIATIALILSSTVITASFLGRYVTGVEQVLATVIISFTHAASILLIFGTIFAGIRPEVVAPASISLSIILYILSNCFSPETTPTLRSLLIRLVKLPKKLFRYFYSEKILLPFTALTGAIYAWRSLIALTFPLYDYDGMWYHVVIVAKWIQAHKIYPIYDNLWTLAYPKNGEILYVWIALFTHSAQFIRALSIVSSAVCAIAAVCIFRLLFKNRFAEISLLLAVLLIPSIIVTVGSSYVDSLQTAVFMISLFFFLKIYMEKIIYIIGKDRDHIHGAYNIGKIPLYVVYILSIAFGAGIKTVGLGYAIVFLSISFSIEIYIMFMCRRLQDKELDAHEKHHIIVRNLYYMSIFSLIFLLFSSYWYITNFFILKNPLFPYSLLNVYRNYSKEIFVTQIPPLMYKHHSFPVIWPVLSWLTDLRPVMQPYDTRPGGFGPNFILIYLPAMVAVIVMAIVCVKSLALRNLAFSIMLLLPTFLSFAISPLKWWSRFTLFLPIIGAISYIFVVYVLFRSQFIVKLLICAALSLSSAYCLTDAYLTSSTYSFLSIIPKGRSTLRNYWFGLHNYMYGPYSHFKNYPKISNGSTTVFISDDQDIYYPYIGENFKKNTATIRYSYMGDTDTLYALIKSVGGNYFAIQPYLSSYDNNYPSEIRADDYIIGSGYMLGNENIYKLRNIYQQVSVDSNRFRFVGIIGTHYIFEVL